MNKLVKLYKENEFPITVALVFTFIFVLCIVAKQQELTHQQKEQQQIIKTIEKEYDLKEFIKEIREFIKENKTWQE